jgi:hypothetical protein
VQIRGGVSRLRSLHARRPPDVVLDVRVVVDDIPWRYQLAFGQDNVRRPIVKEEKVWKADALLLEIFFSRGPTTMTMMIHAALARRTSSKSTLIVHFEKLPRSSPTRQSRKRAVREALVPKPGTTAKVGPGYGVFLIDFATRRWRPRIAARRSPSLARLRDFLRTMSQRCRADPAGQS